MADFLGTPGDDSLQSNTDGADRYFGFDGNDILNGGSGDDRYYGGGGNDTILPGPGADLVYGDAGDDLIWLSSNDTIWGGTGIDTLDATYGNYGETVIWIDAATATTDNLSTVREVEIFISDEGDDNYDASLATADLTILTGAGNDTITGGLGNDTIDGGDGDDIIDGGNGPTTTTIDFTETFDGGAFNGWALDEPTDGNLTGEASGGADGAGGLLFDDAQGGDEFLVAPTSFLDNFPTNGTITSGTLSFDVQLSSTQDLAAGNLQITGNGGQVINLTYSAQAVTGSYQTITIDLLDAAAAGVTDAELQAILTNIEDLRFDIDFNTNFPSNDEVRIDNINLSLEVARDDNDTLTGGAGNDTFVYNAGDGTDVITDFNAGNTGTLNDGDQTNNDFVDLSAFYNDTTLADVNAAGPDSFDKALEMLRADAADGTLDGIINGTDYSAQIGDIDLTLRDSSGTATGSELTFENTNVCFTKGTLIATPDGAVPIETLREGDLVLTRDNGPQRLLWVGSNALNAAALDLRPNLKPIRLSARFFGLERDLIVSPQHGVLLRHDDRGGTETLYRATHLARMQGGGARVMQGCRGVTYYHLLFAEHQIVFGNGMASESLYPGEFALGSMTKAKQREIFGLFPELEGGRVAKAYGPSVTQYSRWKKMPETLRALV